MIKPELIEFISYPYEWCFSQYQDAALTTLEIERRALSRGMTLKDCSAYNVQFQSGRPIFIDTLSFETYREGEPWTGYRQFCEHFVAPLALMSLLDHRLGLSSAGRTSTGYPASIWPRTNSCPKADPAAVEDSALPGSFALGSATVALLPDLILGTSAESARMPGSD